jgi:hypothetical protein
MGEGSVKMQTAKEMMINLLNALLPNRAAPVLGRVIKAYEGPGKCKYAVDVCVVTAGTLEDTKQTIAEVPISPIWIGQKGKGLYAIPPVNALVIIEYLHWNTAYPYVSGIWSDEYEAGEFKQDQFVLTDGEGMNFIIDAAKKSISLDNGKGSVVTLEDKKVIATNGKLQVVLNGDKAAIKNDSKSLFTILDTHFQNLIAMKTMGAPPQHVVSADTIAKFRQDKADLSAIMEA